MTKVKRQEGGAVMFTDGPLSRRKRTRVLPEKSRKRWKGKKNGDSTNTPNPSRLTSRYEKSAVFLGQLNYLPIVSDYLYHNLNSIFNLPGYVLVIFSM